MRKNILNYLFFGTTFKILKKVWLVKNSLQHFRFVDQGVVSFGSIFDFFWPGSFLKSVKHERLSHHR